MYCSLFTLFFSLFSFGQEDSLKPLHIDKLDIQFILKNNVAIHVDTTRKQSFKEVQRLTFKKRDHDIFDHQSKNWFKFYVNPQIDAKQLIFSSSYADSVNVFVPYKSRYKKTTIGRLTKTDITFSIYDNSILHIPTDSIDFSKPFYFNKITLTRTPYANAYISGYVILTDKYSTWKNKKDKAIGYTMTSNIFFAVLFVTMLIFLMNYGMTRDQNFLNYSLYLLFTLLIFVYNFPVIVNFINDIHPLFIDSISQASIPLASGAYFYFVIYFINVKEDFPKLYPLAKYTVVACVIFAALCIIQLFFFPYLKYRWQILASFEFTFLFLSISVFIYLVLQRLNLIKRIIIFGSFLLIVGQALSLLLANYFFFLGAVIIEIIVFASVVSFQNKQTLHNQVRSEAALANEKIKRENLQEIDNLKSRFITNITHEFRTPLTIILGYVETLKGNLDDQETNIKNLETIERNSSNLLNLVNEMLDLAQLEQGSLAVSYSKSDISKFAKITTESFESLAFDKGIKIAYTSAIKNPILDFDSEKIRQVLSNLLSNAIKFTERGDTIKVHLSATQEQYHITVSDTGAGIPESEVEHIFDRFYQVKNNSFKISQGTGIGLALTKELVHILQGTITVHSKVDIGTTFTMKFPITRKAIEDGALLSKPINIPLSQETESIIQEANQEAPTVLVVEDNRDMSKYITSCLQGIYQVTTAFNGEKGYTKAIKETPDIIISDVMMPKMDGYEMTQKLQEHKATNHIPIILLTSKSQQEDKLEGLAKGADAYLVKPFQKTELLLRLEKLVSKRKALQKRYQLSNVLDKKQRDKNIKDQNMVFLNKAIACIHKAIAEPKFNSQMLSQELALSDSQLYRKLKAITNNSTAIFIRNVRLEKAKELLDTSSKTVSEIAYECGFTDPNWFGKAFKERYALTPSSYRNTSKNNI